MLKISLLAGDFNLIQHATNYMLRKRDLHLIDQGHSKSFCGLAKAGFLDNSVESFQQFLFGQFKERDMKTKSKAFSFLAVGELIGHDRDYDLNVSMNRIIIPISNNSLIFVISTVNKVGIILTRSTEWAKIGTVTNLLSLLFRYLFI